MIDETKIVSLEAFRLTRKPPEPMAQPYKDDMLALLREVIAEVESGALRGFVIARGYAESSSVDLRGFVSGPEVLWLVERMKKTITP